MPSPARRWIRDLPFNSVLSGMWRLLRSRRPYLWTLLILLVVCFAVHTFVTRQVSFNKENLFTPLQNVWEGLHTDSSQAVKQEMLPPHMRGTGNDHHQNEEHGKPLTNNLLTQSTRNVLTADEDKNLLITHSSSSSFKTHIKSGHTTAMCQPKSHIVFLKTHKTASSTVLNILYRYGESRNLSFALPKNKHSQLFYPYFFVSHFVEGFSTNGVKEFHIMCNHMRFKKSEVAKVMPADTFYFSILRNPVDLMESIFTYYKSIPAFANTQSLDKFLDNCWQRYNPSISNNHYAHNIMAFDFGFNNNITAYSKDLEERASRVVTAIEQDFHLILISEYFDESMILLKHVLCWSLDDVASFRLNSRSEQSRHSLSNTTAEKVKRWNALDWRIYLHFNSTFWHKVDSLVGREQMKVEVSQLRALQTELTNTCLKDGRAVNPSQVKDTKLKPFQYGAAVIQGYNLNPKIDGPNKIMCQRLITPELQYTEKLYIKQFPERASKHRRAARQAVPQLQNSLRAGVMGKAQTKHGSLSLNQNAFINSANMP
ncbi:galactose-3-O-sulfotransferase 2 [Aulostomus maculatus]